MVNEKINKRIVALWKKHFGTSDKVYAPIFYDDFEPGGLLFIGVNPSFNPKGSRRAVRGTEFENLDPESFYRWSNIVSDPKYIDMCIAIGRHVHEKYGTYFKRMHDIAKTVGMPFQHIDIFLYKQTSQKDFLSLVYEKKGELNEFGRDQLEIFHEILASMRPVAIVVANAFASRIIRKHLKHDLMFDDTKGFHGLRLGGKLVPIFFSSMLSGQRALDTGSYERLVWHVRQAVSTVNIKSQCKE
ncbi:MAG TPA: hypothetical protein VJH94_00745 [Candidatus Paceibacterota bacterium]